MKKTLFVFALAFSVLSSCGRESESGSASGAGSSSGKSGYNPRSAEGLSACPSGLGNATKRFTGDLLAGIAEIMVKRFFDEKGAMAAARSLEQKCHSFVQDNGGRDYACLVTDKVFDLGEVVKMCDDLTKLLDSK